MLTDRQIIEKYKIKSSEKILDVGGSMKQHEGLKIDTLVDIFRPEEVPYTPSKLIAKNFVRLDVARERLPFGNKEFDFCLCTHTLEDLSNPELAINEMARVAKRGYIVTPSFGSDLVFSHVDFTDWLTGARRVPGAAHHKWLFYKKGKKMRIIAKNYPILYTPRYQIAGWSGEQEFEYYWEDKIDYEIVNDISPHRLIEEYDLFMKMNRGKIKRGLVLIFLDSPYHYLKELSKLLLKKGYGFIHRQKS